MAGPAPVLSGIDASPGAAGAVSLRGVTKTYDSGVLALGGIDLDVREGEFVSLLGPSGCGKSTALRLIAGLSAATSGTVRVANHAGGGGQSIRVVAQETAPIPRLRLCAN